jgi:hypothetical protein
MNELDDRAVAQRVRVMQIIATALPLGVVGFLGFACFQIYARQDDAAAPAAAETPILTMVAFAMLAVCAGLSLLAPSLQTQKALRQIAEGTWQTPAESDPKDYEGDTAKLLATRQVAMIIGFALLEAPAFLGCIAFLLEARLYVLAVVALALAGMLLRFPTEGRVRAWLWQQQERLNRMRPGGSSGSRA